MASTALVPTGGKTPVPDWLKKINEDYKAKVAHVFVVYGNVFDFTDNTGNRNPIVRTMGTIYDTNIQNDLGGEEDKSGRGLRSQSESESSKTVEKVMCKYTVSQGLEFLHPKSREMFEQFLVSYYGQDAIDNSWRDDWKTPMNLDGLLFVLNRWFFASKEVVKQNRIARRTNQTLKKELYFSIVFEDSDALFPNGEIGQLSADRVPIVNVRNWARDEQIGDRNKIILLTRHITDVHESLRGGMVGVSTIQVPRPTLEDREAWLKNFDAGMRKRTAKQPLVIGDNEVRKVNLARENKDDMFTFHDFAVQSAGMSRRQLEEVIMKSWLTKEDVDFHMVRSHKQRALQDEYEGIVDFFEPEFGFEEVGGHEHLKRYFERKIIKPLRSGDKRLCSKGVLMTGPPGTGKTQIAKALAREARMNFMIGHLDKLFGSLVGDTERKTRKFIEAIDAAAPVIVFIDELDSVLSSGRQSVGDSGVSGRVFNAIMTFLSDDARAGRVVVVAASNRPDLLDAALIRSGRFDAKLPALPPQKGDMKGRIEILKALNTKHKVKFDKDLKGTEEDPSKGLGLLLCDKERVWTGAEIEVVLKEAIDQAVFEDRKAINRKDWEDAFRNILPNTEEVERMTYLSLIYVDHLGYCPPEWRETAADKKALKDKLKGMGWDSEDD